MSEATSVGQIGLDLVVNKKDFNKQMSGIQSLATKVGKKLAAAFAVKKLVDFSEKCIELGSDLSEVQNVVDVTFPAMSKQVDTQEPSVQWPRLSDSARSRHTICLPL